MATSEERGLQDYLTKKNKYGSKVGSSITPHLKKAIKELSIKISQDVKIVEDYQIRVKKQTIVTKIRAR